MERITLKMLQGLCDTLNSITGAPMRPYTKGEDGKFHANIGNYHISGAYGGYCIHRMDSAGGGVTPIFGGHRPKREVYELTRAYMQGLRDAREAQND